MPDIYGPFDGVSWSQDQWYRYSPMWAPSGVLGAAQSSASAGPLGLTVSGLNLSVALGRAWVFGAGYERTSTAWTAAVSANTSTNPRIDRLVLRRDLSAKTVLPTIIQGTPAASPVKPDLQQIETGQFDLPLFSWTTPANSAAPLTSVVDERAWVDPTSGSLGSSLSALKAADTSRPSTTTFADDPHLIFAAVVPGTYSLDGWLSATGGGGDIKYQLAGTATYTATGSFPSALTASESIFNLKVSAGAFPATSGGSAEDVRGVVTVTAFGTVVLQWAQNTSNGAATVLKAGSWLRLIRLA